ncbi:MAG: hypothetical protein V4510_03500 [bacterium]
MQSTPAPRTTAPILMACAALLLASSILAGPATAQVQVGPFGTQVRAGDFDYAPLTKKDAIAVTYSMVNLDGSGNPQADCVVFDTSGTAGIQLADLHASSCDAIGKMAGSLVDSADKLVSPAVNAIAVTGPVTFVYADADASGSFGKGEAVYAKNFAGTTLLPVVAGDWTLRISPTNGGIGGTFVKPSDADAVTSSAQAKTVTMTLVQRDDKIWYLVPAAAAPANGAVTKNTAIPVNSIRLSNAASLQPNVVALGITLGNAAMMQAGQQVSIIVPVQNNGAWMGVGLLVTKIADRIVDARLTPLLSPTDKANVLVSFTIPADISGSVELAVNDVFQVVSVKPADAPAGLANVAGPDTAATIATLQARIDALEAKSDAPHTAAAQPVLARTPALDPVVLVGALCVVALLLRRRM